MKSKIQSAAILLFFLAWALGCRPAPKPGAVLVLSSWYTNHQLVGLCLAVSVTNESSTSLAFTNWFLHGFKNTVVTDKVIEVPLGGSSAAVIPPATTATLILPLASCDLDGVLWAGCSPRPVDPIWRFRRFLSRKLNANGIMHGFSRWSYAASDPRLDFRVQQ